MMCRGYQWRLAVRASSALLLVVVIPSAADAQASGPPVQTVAAPINLGGRGWSASEGWHAESQKAESQKLEFEFRGGLATDYIYRGVTLSDRKPAIGAAIEATYNLLYAGVTVASVKLPTQPAAEISMSGGIRPKLGTIEFDLGATY